MNIKKDEKKFNYGLSILKTILAFYIVKSHCYTANKSNKFFLANILLKNRRIHVPSFFIMSFYFNYRVLISKDIKKKCKRFERLLIPYIFWPIIIYSLNNVFSLLKFTLYFSFKKLIIQLIIGRGIVDVFWFQLNLIIITLLFLISIYIFKKDFFYLLNLLMLISYLLQYSKYSDYFFSYYKCDIQISIGRLIMMIPFGVIGCDIAFFDLINKLKKNKLKTIIFSISMFLLIDYYEIFYNMEVYNGIKRNVLSICLIITFSLLFCEKFKNKYCETFVEFITRYTAGIYYLHMSIHYYLKNYILCFRKMNIESIFLNYIICYLICHLGMLLFGKNKAKYLFC